MVRTPLDHSEVRAFAKFALSSVAIVGSIFVFVAAAPLPPPVSATLAGWFLSYILSFLPGQTQVIAGSPTAPVRAYLDAAFLLAFMVSAPCVLFLAWKYVRPALTEAEAEAAKRFPVAVAAGAYAGATYGLFLISPLTVKFLMALAGWIAVTEPVVGIEGTMELVFFAILLSAMAFAIPPSIRSLLDIGFIDRDDIPWNARLAFYILLAVVISILDAEPFLTVEFLVTVPVAVMTEVAVATGGRWSPLEDEGEPRNPARREFLVKLLSLSILVILFFTSAGAAYSLTKSVLAPGSGGFPGRTGGGWTLLHAETGSKRCFGPEEVEVASFRAIPVHGAIKEVAVTGEIMARANNVQVLVKVPGWPSIPAWEGSGGAGWRAFRGSVVLPSPLEAEGAHEVSVRVKAPGLTTIRALRVYGR